LVDSKGKRKRNRGVTMALLPVLAFIFLIGWCMYWAGGRKRKEKPEAKTPQKDNVTLLPAIFEDSQEIENK